MRDTERLADAGIEPSVGSRRGFVRQRPCRVDDRALQDRGHSSERPWRSLEAVEFATLAWVDWFNHRRLFGPIGFVPPAEYEARYYEQAAVA